MIDFLLLLFIFSSCEKVIEVDLPEQKTQLILNAVIETHKPVIVSVTESLGILDTAKFSFIKHADIEIFENGSFKEKLVYSEDGNYISKRTIPKYGNKYKIVASSYEYNEVFAETDIPANVQIYNVIVKDSIAFDSERSKASISFTINDPGGINYYSIGMYLLDIQYSNDLEPLRVEIQHPGFEFFNYNNEEKILFAQTLNAKEYNIEIFLDSKYLDLKRPAWTGQPHLQLLLNVSTFSPEYTLYRKSVIEQEQSRNNPFAEPAPVYSNVINGNGIVIGKNNRLITINK